MSVATQENFIIRPVTLDDMDAFIELANIWSMTYLGMEEGNVSETLAEWTAPGFNLEESTRLVLTPEGKVIGYVEVHDNSPVPVSVWVWARVHPDYEGLGIGTRMMEWAEARARQAIERAPENALVVMESGIVDTHEASQELFRNLGMEPSHNFYKMRIDMQEAPPAPEWPDGIHVKTLTRPDDDDRALIAKEDSFKDHWGHIELPIEEVMKRWKHHMDNEEDFDASLWFLAMDGDEIAGVNFCWPKEGNDPNVGFVGTLGVRRPWRRKGLARALLLHSFGEFWKRGQKSVMLGVDASSLTGATRLYQQAGMVVYHNFIEYRKVLRDGVDISTITVEE